MIMDILSDTAADSFRLLPFLFFTYLLMELLEHRTGEKVLSRIRASGKFGPVLGGMLGIVPQCGFSAAASSLYAGRVITVGTLLAVYLSTSDEMLPVLISRAVPLRSIVYILVIKALIAVISGLLAGAVYTGVLKRKEKEINIHVVCAEEQCHCEDGILVSAIKHTLRIFAYIFLLSLAMNVAVEVFGMETIAGLFSGVPVPGEMIAALIGLIPNCASSVIITELYLGGAISAGAMISGLLVNAGVGIPVLFRLNRDLKQNMGIVAALYGIGVFWGVILELSGITF